MNQLICALLNLLSGAFQVSNAYSSQLSSPGQVALNPITVPSPTTPSNLGSPFLQLAQLNKKRKQWILYNVGTTTLIVKYMSPPNASSTDWTHILQASGSAGDGSGGFVIDEMWKGAIYVQSTATAQGLCNFTELT